MEHVAAHGSTFPWHEGKSLPFFSRYITTIPVGLRGIIARENNRECVLEVPIWLAGLV